MRVFMYLPIFFGLGAAFEYLLRPKTANDHSRFNLRMVLSDSQVPKNQIKNLDLI